jgi:electron transfer flavoprotein alpha subunit
MSSAGDIIVVAACGETGVEPETGSALAFADRLQALCGGSVQAWILGGDTEAAARRMAHTSGCDVTAFHCPGMPAYVCQAFSSVLVPALRETAPGYVVAAHTSRGGEWAPGVAARMGAACICGVDGLGIESGRPWFSKDRYGGKLKGRYAPTTPTSILTVQPGRFTPKRREENLSPGKVTRRTVAWEPEAVRFQGTRPAAAGASDLKEARIILAAGNGFGCEDNLELIEKLARRLPHSAVAGSRIVCDAGWLGYDRQVGVTGATVMPDLYVAFGISGASQHLAGMQGSRFVIAVNTDANAPIFSEADACIVEDLTAFIPAVLDALN